MTAILKYFQKILLLLFALMWGVGQAQNVNLTDPGWVRLGETYEVVGGSGDHVVFTHFGHWSGTEYDDIVMTFTGTWQPHNLTFNSALDHNYTMITPNPQITLEDGVTVVTGRRIQLSAGLSPTTISGVVFGFDFGATDMNAFYFNNTTTTLGNGGYVMNLPSAQQGKVGYQTLEVQGGGSGNQYWIPGSSTVVATPIILTSTQFSVWDTDSNGQLTAGELRVGLGVVSLYTTPQSKGDVNNWPANAGITTTPLADSYVIPAGNFELFAQVYDANGLIVPAGYTARITGINTLSIHEVDNVDIFQIYPNPTTDVIYIKGVDVKNVFIFDLNGRKVSSSHSENVVDIRCLSNGMYIITLHGANGEKKSHKFIKK